MGEDYSDLQKMYQQKVHGPNLQSQQNQDNMNQPYPKKPGGNAGCIVIVLAAGMLIAIGIAVFLLLSPDIISKFNGNDNSKNVSEKQKGSSRKDSKKSSLEGALTNAVIVKGDDDRELLWIISYEYKGSKYLTNTYIYNPYEEEILKYSGEKTDEYPPTPKLLLIDNELWKINSESGGTGPGIFIYNPATGEEISNTDAFIRKYPELNSGISRIYLNETPPRMEFETKDGRKPYFDIANKKIYSGYADYRNTYKNKNSNISIFALGIENSSESARKRLFLVTGPESSLWERRVEENYFSNLSTVRFMTKSDAKVLIEDKIFLEGVLLYQNEDACYVFYQNQTGSNAERYLSCIGKDGNILWTVSTEDELFSKLKATDKESTSSMFFMKSSIHLSCLGNLVLLSHDRDGFIGLDYKTGKVMFKVEMK